MQTKMLPYAYELLGKDKFGEVQSEFIHTMLDLALRAKKQRHFINYDSIKKEKYKNFLEDVIYRRIFMNSRLVEERTDEDLFDDANHLLHAPEYLYYEILYDIILYKYRYEDEMFSDSNVEDVFSEEDVEALEYLFSNRDMIHFIIDCYFILKDDGSIGEVTKKYRRKTPDEINVMLKDFVKCFDLEKGKEVNVNGLQQETEEIRKEKKIRNRINSNLEYWLHRKFLDKAKSFKLKYDPFCFLFEEYKDDNIEIILNYMKNILNAKKVNSSLIWEFFKEYEVKEEKYIYVYIALLIAFSKKELDAEILSIVSDFSALLKLTELDMEDMFMVFQILLKQLESQEEVSDFKGIHNTSILSLFFDVA